MTTIASSPPATHSGQSPLKSWLGVTAVAVGIFSLVTTELLPVGLLTSIGSTMHVSDGTVGLMMTVPGIIAAITAPWIFVAAGGFDRRLVLCSLMALLTAANLICAFAPNLPVLLVARVLVGLSIGGFWAIAGGLAVRLVPERFVGQATSVIFGGVATASVLGIPVGTLLGELRDWRTAFAVVGLLGLAVLIALVTLLPPLPATQTQRLRALPQLFRNSGVRVGLAATFFLVTGHFTAYTFVSPVLQQVSGIDASLLSPLLLVYGVAGIVGNFVAGSTAARGVRRTLLLIVGMLTMAMLLMPLLGGMKRGAIALLIVWGLAYGGVSVSLQLWILKAAPQATEAASALFVSMFNLSISLGALIGGFAIDGIATTSVMWLGGALVLLTTVAVWTSRKTPFA